MQKFLTEEDELLLNNQPEQSVVIDIEEPENLYKETNLDEAVLNNAVSVSEDIANPDNNLGEEIINNNDEQDVGGESDNGEFDNTPTVIEKTV